MKKIIAFYVVAVIVIVSGVCAFIYFFPSKPVSVMTVL